MNLKFTAVLGFFFCLTTIFAQEAIDVTEQTIKLDGNKETELYFGFAEGDKIVFNFKGKKKSTEVEIIEYPGISRFSDYKTRKVKNKTITVSKKGVYAFRFKNTSWTGKICKIQIQRIPASEATKSFNSAVTWETKQVTTYNTYTKDIVAGYDTTYIQKTRKELVKTELVEEMIMDKSERVHSMSNLDYSNRRSVKVTLPSNQVTTYKTKEMTAWAYWIGVGKESSEAWSKNVKIASNIASGLSYFTAAGPLGKIAIGTITSLAIPTSGEDVSYSFIPDLKNSQLFMAEQEFRRFDKGRGVAGYGKRSNRLEGEFYIGLLNDNKVVGIDVEIKISVIWEIKTYEDKHYTEMTVNPRYQKKQFTDPVITTSKVPVTG